MWTTLSSGFDHTLKDMSCSLQVAPPVDGSEGAEDADSGPARPSSGRGRGRGWLARRDLGPVIVALLVVANAVLWLFARPDGEPLGRFIGQLIGAESVLLMSVGLVLMSNLAWVEVGFDGMDRAVVWHRRVAMTGMVLLVPHIAMSSNPHPTSLGVPLAVAGTVGLAVLVVWAVLPRWRSVTPAPLQRIVVGLSATPPVKVLRRVIGGYDRWRSLHRLTGLFVAAGFAHGALDATAFGASPLLRWSYLVVGGVGLGAYGYRELVVPLLPLHEYRVENTRRLDGGLVELVLAPAGRPVVFTAGQFAMVSLRTKNHWHRHPFTLSSGSGQSRLRIVVKGLGDYTSDLPDLVQAGTPALVGNPHGRFDRHGATRDQIWVAAGVGVAPFLSWARSLDHDDPSDIDFFYLTRGPAPFADELCKIAADRPFLRLHLIDTSRRDRLSPGAVLDAVGKSPSEVTAYLCGPAAMVDQFERGLRGAGVARRHVHREYFAWR